MSPQPRITYDPYRDYYIVLMLSSQATVEEIQRAYRERAKVLHPDRNKEPNATEQFQLLNEAYEVLRDPDLRYVYDRLRAQANGMWTPKMEAAFQSSSASLKGAAEARRREWQKWRAIWRGLLNSPSYRIVFLFIGIVLVGNITFILFSWMNRPVSGEPSKTGERPIPGVVDTERCPAGAFLVAPNNGSQVSGGFEVRGTTQGAYKLDWTPANLDNEGRIQEFTWSPLTAGETPVTVGLLASGVETNTLPTGRIRLRLTVGDQSCEITIQHG
jgi:hypothetical protein